MQAKFAAARLMVLSMALMLTPTVAGAQEALEVDRALNLYFSRHQAVDEALYENFTAQTGIAINRC